MPSITRGTVQSCSKPLCSAWVRLDQTLRVWSLTQVSYADSSPFRGAFRPGAPHQVPSNNSPHPHTKGALHEKTSQPSPHTGRRRAGYPPARRRRDPRPGRRPGCPNRSARRSQPGRPSDPRRPERPSWSIHPGYSVPGHRCPGRRPGDAIPGSLQRRPRRRAAVPCGPRVQRDPRHRISRRPGPAPAPDVPGRTSAAAGAGVSTWAGPCAIRALPALSPQAWTPGRPTTPCASPSCWTKPTASASPRARGRLRWTTTAAARWKTVRPRQASSPPWTRRACPASSARRSAAWSAAAKPSRSEPPRRFPSFASRILPFRARAAPHAARTPYHTRTRPPRPPIRKEHAYESPQFPDPSL